MSEEAVQAPKELDPGERTNMAELSAEINSLNKVESMDVLSTVESDMDVPDSPFWGEKDESNVDIADEVEPAVDVSEPSNDQTIKFKANGQDLEITMEEARKRLAMAEGGAKAFTKLAQANKRLKELEGRQSELEKKAQLLDKLEEVKHDWKAILQIATGQDPDQFLAEAMRKQQILETGSDAERAQLEKEERLASLERKLQAQAERQEMLEKQEQERSLSSQKNSLGSLLEKEFFKHQFDMGNDVDSNDVNEMLWRDANHQMKRYVQKYKDHPKFDELLPKMAQKSFEDVAGKLKRLTTGSVQAEVDKVIAQKKQNAAEKAAVASTRRINEVNSESFKGLGIREIADRLVGKKKFSL